MKHYTLLLAILCTLLGCKSDRPDTLVEGGYDIQEMETATARAQAEVDSFITVLEKSEGTDHAVKAPIHDKDEVEHFWLTGVTYSNGQFEGVIGNDPGVVSNVKFGQKWTIKKADISDWMYMKEGKMYGNYTMRPLLKTLPEDQAAKFRSILAEP